jgi:Uma2 family endonuclease
MSVTTPFTLEQFEQLPKEEAVQYELVEGELIEVPSGNLEHNIRRDELHWKMQEFLRRAKLGRAVIEIDLRLGEGTQRRPDVAYFSNERLAQIDRHRGYPTVAPELAIEVLSPKESAVDLLEKIQWYFKNGVQEVWLMYLNAREIHVYTTDTGAIRRVRESESIETPLLPGFSLRVAEIFES